MKKALVLLTLLCSAFLNSYSQSKQDLIKELITVMHQDSAIDKSFDLMISRITKQMQSKAKDSLSLWRSEEAIKSSAPGIKVMLHKIVNEDMIAIYDKCFDDGDINNLIGFYKTESGQKFLRSQSKIQKEMSLMFMKHLPDIQREIMNGFAKAAIN